MNMYVLLIGATLLSLVQAVPVPGSYYTDEAARRLVHFDSHSGDCRLFGDRLVNYLISISFMCEK